MFFSVSMLLQASCLLSILAPVQAFSLSRRTGDDDPGRYSACYPDRGYTKADGDAAGEFLWKNATFARGLNLTTNECIYRTVNTTTVSLCNGAARNRTVNRGEVRRGVEQLFKDCGAGGTFNGIHVVNNLTFASWGIQGPRTAATPPGSPSPNLPGRKKRQLPVTAAIAGRQDLSDPCTGNFYFDGTQRFDCKHINQMDATGLCPGDLTPDNKCSRYCEVWRVGFLGIEQTLPGQAGVEIPAGQKATLQAGVEFTISWGFSVGIEGVFREVFAAGISYNYQESVTTSLAIAKEPLTPIPAGKYGRWVAFPKYIESCGSISRRQYNPGTGSSWCGTGCVPIVAQCVGDVETLGHQCTRSPALDSLGKPIVDYALRFEECANGKCTILPFAQQSQDYTQLCKESGDPDQDGEIECHYGTIAPPPGTSGRK